MTTKVVIRFQGKKPALAFVARVRTEKPEGYKDITTPYMYQNNYVVKVIGEFTDAQVKALKALRN